MQVSFKYIIVFFLSLFFISSGKTQSLILKEPARIVLAPGNPARWDQWKNELSVLRNRTKKQIAYSDSLYRVGAFRWAAQCYSVYMLMLFDQRFYNTSTGIYDVDAVIKKGIEEFGGYDAVVLWHAYPRIGFDDRNQFDYYREIKGLKGLIKQFHQKGIRVFIDYNPWDTGTKRTGKKDADALADLIKDIDADGIFLDTMNESAKDFRKKLDEARAGIVLESELELPVEGIGDHHMSWAQWYDDSYVPGILWNKWFERKHMLHMIRRWDKDHTGELHAAWMNGCGMIVWDNIFGTANEWNERDKSILRQMLPIQRKYHAVFSGEGWNPLYKVEMDSVFSNQWFNDSLIIWTVVNRGLTNKSGTLFRIKVKPGIKYYDLINGKETGILQNDSVIIQTRIGSRGIGAIVALREKDIDPGFFDFLRQQAGKSISEDSSQKHLHVEQLKISISPKYESDRLPTGMCLIEKSEHRSKIEYTDRECGFYDIPYKINISRNEKNKVIQDVTVSLPSYAFDLTLVTNAEFYKFISASNYSPVDTQNFLKHWIDHKPPKGKEQLPVVYINIDDAKAYARWAGKRLPTEQEWQYAAEGTHQNKYPWGNEFKNEYCNNGQFNGTTSVRQFEKGKSFFGCYDMCGNVWEWTDSERTDGFTRFCIIKGGSYYKAKGSIWYADGGAQPASFSAKFILISPGLDRCATIGFRCAADIK